ncbi:KWG Leptospira [uncultured Clostridium sp.]|uniref:WG repeat-containing protein n=1 Tax=Paeniclostridium hominis TaxID=2764329 RepID=UPI0008206D75|nr:WG repeat-containing protein [Paeniclostridium hominis]SCI70627.1 KWG Leptospira [uncultured Clostridium sp.]SCI84320.1 KWG Leptospira [uncultured Clostridium sp.]
MVLLFQILFFILIIGSSFGGLKSFIVVFSGALLFTFLNVFTLPLLLIQSSVIIGSGVIGLFIAIFVSVIKKIVNFTDELEERNAYKKPSGQSEFTKKYYKFIKSKQGIRIKWILVIGITIFIATRPIVYNGIRYINSAMAMGDGYRIEKRGKFGMLNKNWKMVVPTKYDSIEYLNGAYIVEERNKYGVVNSKGNIILPIKYDEIRDIDKNLIFIRKDNKYGAFNTQGKETIPIEFDSIGVIDNAPSVRAVTFDKDDLIEVCLNNKYGIVNQKGKYIIPAEYDDLSYLGEGVIVFKKNNKYGAFNKLGKIIIPNKYDEISASSTGGTISGHIIDFEGYGDYEVKMDKFGKILDKTNTEEVQEQSENDFNYDNDNDGFDWSTYDSRFDGGGCFAGYDPNNY